MVDCISAKFLRSTFSCLHFGFKEPCSDCLEEENGEDAVDAKFSNGQASYLAPDTKIDRSDIQDS